MLIQSTFTALPRDLSWRTNLRKYVFSGFLLLALNTVAHAQPAQPAQTCQDYFTRAELSARLTPPDHKGLQDLLTQVRGSPRCGENERTCFGYLVANTLAFGVSAPPKVGASPRDAENLAVAAVNTARTWRALWTLADVVEQRKDFDKAALYYKSALTEIAEVERRIAANEKDKSSFVCANEKEELPSKEDTQKLIRLASQADALSKGFVPPPKMRDGSFGGIFVGQLRGLHVRQYPLPIEFEYNSVELTPKGKDALQFLSSYLKNSDKKQFAISGHADRKGTDAYNCELSKRRLAALVTQLKRDLPGDVRIDTFPQGKGEPFPVVEGSNLTADEIDQVNRRIELREQPEEIARKCP